MMSSFSCSHIDEKNNFCNRLKKECVPGRKGCVLSEKKYTFAVPAEERVKEREKEKGKTLKY